MGQNLKIAILGAGNVGGALGRLWTAKGHEIKLGKRDANAEAVSGASVVALCVPWQAAEEAIKSAGDLSGKVLIDCVNPLSPDMKSLLVGTTTSAAEQASKWAKGAKVVKAFNTIGAPLFGNAQFGAQKADGFFCGDDQAAKDIVRGLIEDAGLDPVDVGPLTNARLLEPLALLWIDLAVNQKQGINHGFKLLRR